MIGDVVKRLPSSRARRMPGPGRPYAADGAKNRRHRHGRRTGFLPRLARVPSLSTWAPRHHAERVAVVGVFTKQVVGHHEHFRTMASIDDRDMRENQPRSIQGYRCIGIQYETRRMSLTDVMPAGAKRSIHRPVFLLGESA